jgi:hypothetical protein
VAHAQTIVRLWRADREGTEDYTALHFPTSIAPESAIAAALGDFASATSALSDSPLSVVEVEFLYVDNGLPPLATPDLSQVGTLIFLCEPAPDDQMLVSIPAMLASCYLADGVTIDLAVAAVADLVGELLAPGAPIVCNPFDASVLSYEAGMRRTIPVEFPEATG